MFLKMVIAVIAIDPVVMVDSVMKCDSGASAKTEKGGGENEE